MTHLLVTELEQVPPLKENLTTDDNAGRIGNKTYDGKSAHALSAGALANYRNTFAFIDIIGEIVDCLYLSFSSEKRGSQVFYFQNFLSDGPSPHFSYFVIKLSS